MRDFIFYILLWWFFKKVDGLGCDSNEVECGFGLNFFLSLSKVGAVVAVCYWCSLGGEG